MADVARTVGFVYRTVQKWLGHYRRRGLAALRSPARPPPRPERLTPEQWEAVRTHLRKGTTKTIESSQRWIAGQWQVEWSYEGLRKALHRHRLRLKVPRPRHEKTDRAAQEAWKKGGLAQQLGAALARSNEPGADVAATSPADNASGATSGPEMPEGTTVPLPDPRGLAREAPDAPPNDGGAVPSVPCERSRCGAVLFCDEMRLGLHGQVRRVWAPVGEKVEQVIQIVYRWTYLLLAVDPLAGRLAWAWVPNMKAATLAPSMAGWKAQGMSAVVLDRAPAHRSADLKAAAPPLVPLPPYSPELDPAERIFRALRPVLEGEVHESIEAKQARADAWLRELATDPDRVRSLTAWSWLVPQVLAATAA